MIPLRDNIPPAAFPVVNYALIGVTAAVWLLQLGEPAQEERLVERYGMIPSRISDPDRPVVIKELVRVRDRFGRVGIATSERLAEPPTLPPVWTLLTCMFLHGGWLHFLGNMWTLYIFGDNVEDRLGKLGYLIFYLLSGVAASLVHYWSEPQSTVPTIGASGAIAGVMGAYFLLYPRAMVLTLVPIFFFIEILVLPAQVFLGLWFLLQFFQGLIPVGSTASGGVAWWAHIGGFAAGAAIVYLLRRAGALRPPVREIRPGADRIRMYRLHRH
jgi:hypothetical protein